MIRTLTFDDYRADPAWSSSDLKAYRQGPPSLVMWRRANPSEDTDSTRIGTACHAAILEGDAFGRRFAFKPEDMSFATKEGKAWRAAQAGRTILTHAEAETVQSVALAFRAKHTANEARNRALGCESSVFWNDENGVQCKARPDWYDDDAVYDLKVTRYATAYAAGFRAWAEGWMHQLAWYRAGLNANGVPCRRGRLVLVHPKAPHAVYLIEPKVDVLDLIALENAATVAALQGHAESGIWPGTPDDWTLTDLPPAALSASLAVLDDVKENA